MSAKTVFVSYRRDAAGKAFARSLKQELTHRGYDVFLDVDCIEAGRWAEQILTQVPQRAHFLLVLTPGALDRCGDAEDWVRREFELAVQHQRNIVPIREEAVDLAQLRERCPDCMKRLFDWQIVPVRHGSFDSEITALVERHIPPHKAPQQTAAPAIPSLHQLPPPLADFTGRDDELLELRRSAAAGGALISGLQGAGGIGKTALALVLAHEWKDRYPDAQLFLNLHGVDPAPLAPEKAMEQIIHAFHPDARLPDDREALAGIYRSVLTGRRALLLLDNARDAAQIEPLLPPNSCGVLITSRWRFVLAGLKLKEIGVLSPESSAQLLREICDRLDDSAARKIAWQCGYLPLALRLAGAALANRPALKPEDYSRRLDVDRLKQLDPVARSLQVSYDLLDQTQQAAWRTLAVFPAIFDPAAAAAVWNGESDAAEMLETLHIASMVEWNVESDRYRLHDLAREFAWRQLPAVERDAAQLRHARHYREVGDAADKLYLQGGENVLRGLQLFDRERAHMEAAFDFLASSLSPAPSGGKGWGEGARDFAALLVALVDAVVYTGQELRFHPRQRIQWLEAQRDAARITKHRQAEGNALGNLGLAYADLGEPRKAIEFYEQGLVIDREIGDRRGEGTDLGNLGIVYKNLGEPRKAIEFYEQQLKIVREVGDRRGEGNALGNLGNAYANLGEARKAIELYEQDLAIRHEIGDRRGEGNALGNLGSAYASLGEPRKAIEFYEQQMEIVREIGDRRGEGNALFNSALALDALGERAQAIARAEAALRIFEVLENPNAAKVRAQLAEWRGN